MICDDHSHIINSCPWFLSLSPEDRLGEVRRLDICRKCLGSGLQFVKLPCLGSQYHSLLHFGGNSPAQGQHPSPEIFASSDAVSRSVSVPVNSLDAKDRFGDVVLLATANILVSNCCGVLLPCRALLGSGSQVHLVTSSQLAIPML